MRKGVMDFRNKSRNGVKLAGNRKDNPVILGTKGVVVSSASTKLYSTLQRDGKGDDYAGVYLRHTLLSVVTHFMR